MNAHDPHNLGLGRELDAFALDDETSTLADTPPSGAEAYRYSCPVDHAGNMVNLRGWRRKDSQPSQSVILIHDVGESISMYRASAYYLSNQGLSCYAYDQRGHGNSTERLGEILRIDTLVQDLLQVVAWVRHLHGGIRPVIVGQGYGCLVGLEMTAKYPDMVNGLILSAPTVELSTDLHPFRRMLMKLFAEVAADRRLPKILRPMFSNPKHKPVAHTFATRIVKGLISSDDIKISSGFAWELLVAMERFPSMLQDIKVPALVLLPEADEVARFERVKNAVHELSNKKIVECISIEDLHHNAFTESDAAMQTVAGKIVTWVTKHFTHHPQK